MDSDFSTYHSILLVTIPKIHTDLLWDLTILFTGLGFVYFLVVFFFRNRLTQKAKKAARRKKELGPMISNFLFYEDDATNSEKVEYFNLKLEIRELLKDDFNRKVLVEILLDLQKDIAGDAAQRLSKLYRNLGLHLDAFDRLKSRRWEVVSRGILELTQLQVDESYGFIRKFINHKRGVIRKQAQLATVSLKHEGISYFLDTNRYRISEWQQLKLMDEIRNLENFEPPRFRAWLTSRNRDVVLFSLRLIKFYKQNDANTSLIELVKHRNNQIKIEAIECIKEFCVLEALDTLKAVYRKCNAEVKIQILDAIGQMGEKDDIIFLRALEKKELNFLVRSKVISAINCITPGTILPYNDIIAASLPDEEPVIEFGSEIPPIDDNIADPLLPDMETEEDLNPVHPEYESASQPFEERAEVDEVVPVPSMMEAVRDTILEIPLAWEIPLDLDNEDPEIFEICFMEELQDILADADYADDPSEVGVLPLDFLPVVTEDSVKQEIRFPDIPAAILELEVISHEVSEDAKFRLELDVMLQRIRVSEDIGEVTLLTEQSEDWDTGAGETGRYQDYNDRDNPARPETPLTNETHEGQTVEAPEDISAPCPTHTADSENDIPSGEVLLLPGKSEETEQPQVPGEIPEPLFHIIDDITKNTETDELETRHSGDDQHQDMTASDTAYSSIFHELFRRADTESRLILLDEILAVGDEKELQFINALTTSPDHKLRDKAILLSGQLQDLIARRHARKTQCPEDEEFTGSPPESINGKDAVLEGKSDSSVDGGQVIEPLEECFRSQPGEPFNLFEVEFELTRENPDPVAADGGLQSEHHTLLDNILSIPVKIIDRFNG